MLEVIKIYLNRRPSPFNSQTSNDVTHQISTHLVDINDVIIFHCWHICKISINGVITPLWCLKVEKLANKK